MYAMSTMTSLEKWVDEALATFIQRMHDQGSKAVDLGNWLQLMAFGKSTYLFSDIGSALSS